MLNPNSFIFLFFSVALIFNFMVNLGWAESKLTLIEQSSSISDKNNQSPLIQFRSGIPLDKIQCKNDLILIIKVNHGLPICVKETSASTLIGRGWAMLPDKYIESMHNRADFKQPAIIIPDGILNPSTDSGLDPFVIVVQIGVNDTISWINKADVSLTLTAVDNSWSTGAIKPGETEKIKLKHAGFYEYSSGKYPAVRGYVVVLDDDVESLDLQEKLRMAQAILMREMRSGSPLWGVGSGSVDNVLEINLDDELKRIPNAKEYYEKKYKAMIPFDIPIRIEFGPRPSPN